MAEKKKDPAEPEGEEEFSVEKVLDRRVRNGKVSKSFDFYLFMFNGFQKNILNSLKLKRSFKLNNECLHLFCWF